MTTKDLIAQFNIVARTEYNKAYQEFEPKFKELMFEYESGAVETVNFPFFEFLQGMEKFTGSRKHQTFPDGYKFQVTNEEWDMSVDIKRKDIERASTVNSLKGLNPYKLRISEMPKLAKDHPIELAFDMLEAGDASTFGLTFDGQNFFDTTHNYGTTAGTQNNIITGGGVTVALLIADLTSAITRVNSFYYNQGGTTNGKKRKLNKTMKKLLVVCPDELFGTFDQVRTQSRLASGETNPMMGRFDLVSRPFTDVSDWYLTVVDEGQFRPFLYQVEKQVELDMPTPQDEGARERKVFTWGAYGRYNVAYGAWWKAVQITNT